MMTIIGIGDVVHDAALTIQYDSGEQKTIEEERLTRVKHGVHIRSEHYTLANNGRMFHQLIKDMTTDLRERKFQRLLHSLSPTTDIDATDHLLIVSSLFSHPVFVKRAYQLNHHLAHAASAFFASPFDQAAILTIDGRGSNVSDGRQETALFATGYSNHIEELQRISGHSILTLEERQQGVEDTLITFSNSLGAFYKNISVLLGMGHDGEGKTMALAAFGDPSRYQNLLWDHIKLLNEGQFTIDNRAIYFWLTEQLSVLLHCKDTEQFRFKADLAAAHQACLEKVILHCCHALYQQTKQDNICLAGGVFLNTAANRRIREQGPFKHIFIQPAVGDNGIAIGCALYGKYVLQAHTNEPKKRKIFNPYQGRRFNQLKLPVKLGDIALGPQLQHQDTLRMLAEQLATGKIIGFFEGPSEVGPRALGHRSLLADPRNITMKHRLNLSVKQRETFRPFAPAVLAEYAEQYFIDAIDSPYMLMNFQATELAKKTIPAALHIDYTARVQTVSAEFNHSFYLLIQYFYELTGVPVLLNTSFNGRGEPIVDSPEDAIACFTRLPIEILYLDGITLTKTYAVEASDHDEALLTVDQIDSYAAFKK